MTVMFMPFGVSDACSVAAITIHNAYSAAIITVFTIHIKLFIS